MLTSTMLEISAFATPASALLATNASAKVFHSKTSVTDALTDQTLNTLSGSADVIMVILFMELSAFLTTTMETMSQVTVLSALSSTPSKRNACHAQMAV